MEELLLWLSLLDNAPNYLVGCITQKRWKNFHCGFLALRTCAFILKSVPKLLECRPTQTLGSRQDFLPSKFIHLCSFLQGHHQDKFDNNRTENIITFSYTIKYFIYKNLRILNNVYGKKYIYISNLQNTIILGWLYRNSISNIYTRNVIYS